MDITTCLEALSTRLDDAAAVAQAAVTCAKSGSEHEAVGIALQLDGLLNEAQTLHGAVCLIGRMTRREERSPALAEALTGSSHRPLAGRWDRPRTARRRCGVVVVTGLIPITTQGAHHDQDHAPAAPPPLPTPSASFCRAPPQRPDGAIMLPERRGRGAANAAQALLTKGLVREIRAKADGPVWRQEADTGSMLQPGADQGRPIRCRRRRPRPVQAETPLPLGRSGPPAAAAGGDRRRGGAVSAAALRHQAGRGHRPAPPRRGLERHRADGRDRLAAPYHAGRLTGLRKRGYAVTREAGDDRVGVSHRRGRQRHEPSRREPTGARSPQAGRFGSVGPVAGRPDASGRRSSVWRRSIWRSCGCSSATAPGASHRPASRGPAAAGAGLPPAGRASWRPAARHAPAARPHRASGAAVSDRAQGHGARPVSASAGRRPARCWCASGRAACSPSRCSAEGFAWNGTRYASLSAVACAMTGTKWNGRRFFGLDRQAGERPRGLDGQAAGPSSWQPAG